ncbi:hypothetical protein SprV_0602230000 [Sparganum proliferum]
MSIRTPADREEKKSLQDNLVLKITLVFGPSASMRKGKKTCLTDYNTFDVLSKPVAARTTSSSSAYAKGNLCKTSRTPTFGERFHVPDDICADIRSCATGLLRQKKHHQTLPTEEKKALRSLKTDDKIVIMSADNGGTTVIMDKVDYVNKANQIFDDREAYAPLAADPTKTQAATIKKKVNELARLKLISPDDSRSLTLIDPRIARAYGLPKVHKTDAPLWISVPLIISPTYNLAKWLYKHLKHLANGSQCSIKNFQVFLQKIQGLELRPEGLVGFGKRYTAVDGDRADKTDKDLVIVPADKGRSTVLQRLESLVFQHHKPKFWARYVDDTFVVIDWDQLLTFKERLNEVFPDIQFTMEEEENNQLAFLDVVVCRKDCGGPKTKVFRKATNTIQVLNFNSNPPISHKRSCVRTLYRHVEPHCSEPEDKIAELQYL